MNEPMTDTTEITVRSMPEILRDLAIVRRAKEGVKRDADLIVDRENALKDELLVGMLNAGIVTGNGAGLKVSVVKRHTYVVTDDERMITALRAEGPGVLESFSRLDRTGAAKYAADHGLEDVVRLDVTTSLRVSEVQS